MRNMINLDALKPSPVTEPTTIVKEQCDYLTEATNGAVIGKIVNYSGTISSYRKLGLAEVSFNLVSKLNEKSDITRDLGEVCENLFTYEFYVTSPSTPKYRFRAMLLQYTIPYFPVRIILEDEIADNMREAKSIVCASQRDFEDKLEKILNTEKFLSIINSLLAISQNNAVSEGESSEGWGDEEEAATDDTPKRIPPKDRKPDDYIENGSAKSSFNGEKTALPERLPPQKERGSNARIADRPVKGSFNDDFVG